MRIIEKVINYVFPFKCYACSRLIESNNGLCEICWPKFIFFVKPYCTICCKKFYVNVGESNICAKCILAQSKIDMVRSLLEFSPESKSLIYKFKYNDKTILAKLFAKLIYNRFQEDLKDVDIIVPVPMHKIKRLFRNYNPPQILACELAKYINKPVELNLLTKKRMTKNQVGLNKKQRSKNLLNSFAVNKNLNIAHKIILLVDDVLTTGATSNECAKVLKREKASKVKLVTIGKVN